MDEIMTRRGLINQILYGVDFVSDLSDVTVVARCVDSMINRRHFDRPVEEYAEAINQTLREKKLSAQTIEMCAVL